MENAVLRIEGLQIGFGSAPLLPPLTFELKRGLVTSVVGHNGSGKSTLLKTILGLQPRLGGQITMPQGMPRFGYVPQRDSLDPIYPVRVNELVDTGRYGLRGLGRRLLPDDHQKIDEAMRSTGVKALEHRLFRTLSGGEQQRALLARAICSEPDVLVLDEPTAALDEKGAFEAINMTIRLAKEKNAAILMVNHFLDLVRRVSDQVILLDRDHHKASVGAGGEVLPRGTDGAGGHLG